MTLKQRIHGWPGQGLETIDEVKLDRPWLCPAGPSCVPMPQSGCKLRR